MYGDVIKAETKTLHILGYKISRLWLKFVIPKLRRRLVCRLFAVLRCSLKQPQRYEFKSYTHYTGKRSISFI